jgi:hypothetical protein
VVDCVLEQRKGARGVAGQRIRLGKVKRVVRIEWCEIYGRQRAQSSRRPSIPSTSAESCTVYGKCGMCARIRCACPDASATRPMRAYVFPSAQ